MSWRKQVTYSQKPSLKARAAHARGEKEFKTYDTSLIRPKQPPVLRIVLAVVAVIVLSLIGWGVASCVTGCAASPSLTAGQHARIVVQEGQTVEDVSDGLLSAGVIASKKDFINKAIAVGLEKSLRPGTYDFEGGMSLDEVVEIFKKGPSAALNLVIPEGLRTDEVAAKVEAAYKGAITKDDFMKETLNARQFADEFSFVSGAYNNSLEGFLYPKTYPVIEGADAKTVIKQMLEQFKKEATGLDFAEAKSKGLSEYDVIKLASMIEKEAASDNRTTVASVFYNRLADNMALQSDATVAYVTRKDPKPEDLKIKSPYNTYLNKGLPAGPICSPGLDCIQAALHPEKTDYLYFYFAKKDGKLNYYFSHNYEDHKQAIQEG